MLAGSLVLYAMQKATSHILGIFVSELGPFLPLTGHCYWCLALPYVRPIGSSGLRCRAQLAPVIGTIPYGTFLNWSIDTIPFRKV